MKLTVAIPTYNRNELLCQTLEQLLPQLTPECELLIIDNCSDVPISATIHDLLQEFPDNKKRIVRNRVNIGFSANVLRCFELCETQWLWVLSDAYPPRPDAIETILHKLSLHPEAIFFNFQGESHNRSQDFKTMGLQDFVEHIDHFGFVLMISVCLFNAKELLPQLGYGYHFSYTLAPHLVLVLTRLGRGGQCHFIADAIVGPKLNCAEKTWSITHYPTLLALRELPLPDSVTKTLLHHIQKELLSRLMAYARQSVRASLLSGSTAHFCYMHDLFRFRWGYENHQLVGRVLLWGVRFLIRYARITSSIVCLIKGKDVMVTPIPSTDIIYYSKTTSSEGLQTNKTKR